uniref:Uncharacterized protein n=1 Tax=Tanacetum cinerariifolium TaxID=118510 RepID=A0A699JCL0_TANCI|nr:hypothetical protein [Tanacetum cinerariifolium]
MSSLTSNTQNTAFLSSTNSSTIAAVNFAQAVNTANGFSTTSTQVNDAFSINIDNLSDVVIYAFPASQPNSPQLAHEDLEKIHPYDIKEMDLRWQMVMLTIRARRGYFAKECRAPINQDFKHKESIKRTMLVETPTSTALVSCDGLRNFMSLKPDLSFTGLDKFVKPEVENSHDKSSEEKTKVVRKNTDAPIIEEWVSDEEEENVAQPKI